MYKFTPLGCVIQKITVFKILAATLLHNKKAKEVVNQNLTELEHREQEVTFSVVEVPKPILECSEPEVLIQLKLQRVPCYTPANSIEEEVSCSNK